MKKMIFVTGSYPFSCGETFIENEIDVLASSFEKVYIFAAHASENDSKRAVPDNVTVFAANPKPFSKKDYFPCFFYRDFIKELFTNCLKKSFFKRVSALCYFYSFYKSCAKRIPEFIKSCNISADDDITIYSYWLITVGMCAVKIQNNLKKMGLKVKAISRCHGFDVYSERSYGGYQPFQKHMISRFDKILPCSKNGEGYLKRLYPEFSKKIRVAYLGVKDRFSSAFPTKGEIFNIVSCSNVIPVKRVNLIIESLSRISDKSISWTHFGDGEDFEKIKKLAKEKLPENIKYEFKGRVPNTEIYDYYNNNNVNLFINVSETEGLPVSIMEAISFGVPVIATDVGGTGEIVSNGKNGFLLRQDFDTDSLTAKILDFVNMPDFEYSNYCEKSREAFVNNFDAKKNYQSFCGKLINDESSEQNA